MKTQAEKEKTRQRTEMLTSLRSQHGDSFKRAQTMLKEQIASRKLLLQEMQGGARSAPQLAKSTGLPAQVVLWHLAAMKKYGLVTENGLDEEGNYYLYEITKEAKP